MLTKTLSESKKKQRNILIKAMNNDIGSIDSSKDSWNPAQISERAKDISYIRSLVDTWNPAQLNEALRMLDLPVIDTWNPAQIEEQRRNLIFYLAERTLTGNPIALKILGNLTPEVTGLKVTMNPIQDLHGYSNPWPGGAGKNLIPYPYTTSSGTIANVVCTVGTNGSIKCNGTANASGNFYLIQQNYSISAGTYTLSVNGKHSGATIRLRNRDDSSNLITIESGTTSESGTATIPSDLSNCMIYINWIDSAVVDVDCTIQLEVGSQATSYAPYSNICPITGRTEASVTRTGKNQFTYDTTYYNGYWTGSMSNPVFNGNNEERTLDEATGWQYVKIPVSGISSIANSGLINQGGVNSCFLSSDNPTDIISIFSSVDNNGVKTIPSNAKYMCLCFYNAKGQSSSYPNAQIEIGSTATAYEPYTAETHTHQYQQEIYGGVDDFMNGGLTNTFGRIDLSTIPILYQTDNGRFYSGALASLAKRIPSNDVPPNFYCECYEPQAINSISGDAKVSASTSGSLFIYDSRFDNIEDFRTAMSGVYLYYELATPTTISTSAEEITLLKGTNVLSTDGDSIELKYKQNF